MEYKFLSKVETLKFLENHIKKSKIEKIYDFTVNDWKENKSKIISDIKNKFKAKIIVRSSAAGEDSFEESKAGNYDSVLNVNSNSSTSIQKAIDKVIASYENKNNENLRNQIFVQTQSTEIITSGVVLTRDHNNASPYYVINFEDGNKTDGVTKGIANNTVKIFKKIERENIPKKWKKLILAIIEIEKIFKIDYLDVEFGINKKQEIIIFQVRPITSLEENKIKINYIQVEKLIDFNKKKFLKQKQCFGKKIFSDMSDWNPAEIIGNDPNLLDYSLYDYLIMNDSWSKGREKIGYKKHEKNLMVKFGNKPYVDVNKSFYSLTPINFQKKISEKLINFYLKKLEKNPHLHDKIEFDIVFSCYDFSLNERLKELKKAGFSQNETVLIKKNLLDFTNDIIKNFNKILKDSEKSLLHMTINRKKINAQINKKSNYKKLLDNAFILLEDCKKYGIIPFSSMARISFIASAMLNSLSREGIVKSEIIDDVMNSINTPLSRFREDYQKLSMKKITKSQFLEEYGHLRPGTYDISALRYDHDDRFLQDFEFNIKNKKSLKKSNLKINNILKKHKILLDSNEFLRFIEKAIQGREELKFEFTKNLSDALELINKAGNELGFSRDDLKELDILRIKNTYKKLKKSDLQMIWKKEILKQVKIKTKNESILLPPIIVSEKDFGIITQYTVKPNFITQNQITSKIIDLKDLNNISDLKNKIILIENADPGYDWIFTKNPSGLITKYGGVASHMSIRCAEIALPAAIGCGELLFEQIKSASKIHLDCKNNLISILEHNTNDESVEIRKALKSLGYIK
ncbi:PEP/pyruvate-binding domain-containing protein [Nitrosopumilus sp.]|uniref:PEP/pyruvate-binding domain-containing protein n=1 Tax=Nitrosopumilus sp. TaxID=2024843 RepID=UPI002610C93D|nr:PEP/pyruvate-binding domain-containing protein [Nitrosopumilus sp.]